MAIRIHGKDQLVVQFRVSAPLKNKGVQKRTPFYNHV